MSRLLVSFSTRPGHGSEGGVGWSFLRAALEVSHEQGQTLYAVCDQRDEDEIRAHVSRQSSGESLILLPVSVPKALLSRYGQSRSRQTYLGWRFGAKRTVAEVCKNQAIDLVHQTTFASAVLPSAIPKTVTAQSVWGPVSVPWAPEYAQGKKPKYRDEISARLARKVARRNVVGKGLIVVTNELTGELFSKVGALVDVEPNIVVDLPQLPMVEREDDLLTLAGLLIDLKRPWLAIQALQQRSLAGYRLQIIGDGPLRRSLESYVNQERLDRRVIFRGRVAHAEVASLMARSRALVHPSVREGSPWVVGEAAAVGVPGIVFEGVGAVTTVKLSNNGGAICRAEGDLAANLAQGVIEVCSRPIPSPSRRWSSDRLPGLLKRWWSQQ